MTPDPALSNIGLLVVGHGTRDPRGVAAFGDVVRAVAQRAPSILVEPALLELADPSIDEGVRLLLERGARQIVVAPLLLFAAGHANRDIPAAVQAALADRSDVVVRHAPVLALDEDILNLSSQRYDDAIAGHAAVAADDTLLVMVGRGSHDPQALDDMREFATRRGEQSPVADVETCFLAMAEPSLDATLARVATAGYRRIVVQPHLLFAGELLDRVRTRVAEWRERSASSEWIVTEPLENVEVLADVVLRHATLDAPSLERAKTSRVAAVTEC